MVLSIMVHIGILIGYTYYDIIENTIYRVRTKSKHIMI